VVESRKGALIEQFIKVADRIGAPDAMLIDLRAAARETQFSRALEAIKHGIPDALMMYSHNPLSLLHNALSDGLHSQDDPHCLELATDIRVLLIDVVNRIATILRDEAELKSAVGRLVAIPRPGAKVLSPGPSE
jgi:hypothetical protein